MAKLLIIEKPSYKGLYTKAIEPHIGDVFESVGYVSATPMDGVRAQHVPSGAPCPGYTHVLFVGDPEFLSQCSMPEGLRYGAYVLSPTQFIPVEHAGWARRVKLAAPSAVVGAALGLAAETELSVSEILPWGVPSVPEQVLNKSEYLQLIAPEWSPGKPTIITPIQNAPKVCAALSRCDKVRAVFVGAPADKELLLNTFSLTPEHIAFTTAKHVWNAADIYLSLEPYTAWPWDVIKALSMSIPTMVPNAHVYQTLIAKKFALPVDAFDTCNTNGLAYTSNSTDIANAVETFLSNKHKAYALAAHGQSFFKDRTAEVFARELIKALFGVT